MTIHAEPRVDAPSRFRKSLYTLVVEMDFHGTNCVRRACSSLSHLFGSRDEPIYVTFVPIENPQLENSPE